jgi:hypothetical protein
MARPFEEREYLEAAQALRDKVKTLQAYRQALTVLVTIGTRLDAGRDSGSSGAIQGSDEPESQRISGTGRREAEGGIFVREGASGTAGQGSGDSG